MQRTAWRGFGDGDAGSGSFDPGDPRGNPMASAGDLAQLVAAADARTAALQNVDPFTAAQARFSALVPSAYRLPLVAATVGVLALVLLSPSDGGGRRRR